MVEIIAFCFCTSIAPLPEIFPTWEGAPALSGEPDRFTQSIFESLYDENPIAINFLGNLRRRSTIGNIFEILKRENPIGTRLLATSLGAIDEWQYFFPILIEHNLITISILGTWKEVIDKWLHFWGIESGKPNIHKAFGNARSPDRRVTVDMGLRFWATCDRYECKGEHNRFVLNELIPLLHIYLILYSFFVKISS